jgi:endo-1,4-beta-xylanase
MKKILTIALCIAMISVLAIPAMAVDTTANKSAISIDGVRDEAYGGPVDINAPRQNAGDGFENAAGAATGKVWTAWDDTSLYLYIEAYDTTPNVQEGGAGNDDNVEIFIDWNEGRGEPGIASADKPFWQIRAFAIPVDLGGYLMEDAADWGGASVFNDVCTHFEGPLNGSYNNGYVVEIKVPAPAVASLSEGKKIPFDVQICDNMLGEGGREGQMFIGHAGDGIDDNEKWQTPAYFSGLMTLGAAYVAPVAEEPALAEPTPDAPVEAAPVTPAVTSPTTAPPTGDIAILLFAVALLGACAVTRQIVKNRA